MNTTSTRLRQLADRMGLDGFAEELREIAGELEAKAVPAAPEGDLASVTEIETVIDWCVTSYMPMPSNEHAALLVDRLRHLRATPAAPSQPVVPVVPVVPEAIEPQDWFESSEQEATETAYCNGWNDCRAAMLAATPDAPSQPVTLTEEWCYSFDEERFHGDCASREEAIAEAKSEAEGKEHTHAWIGKSKQPREFISKKWLGIHIEEYLSERIGDEIGELAELFSLTPEQQEQLGAAVISWVESGPGFRCWAVKDVEEVELADFDESGQIIAALREKELT